MFWLPAGLAPAYVEWVIAFPRAPSGSVSIQVWVIACTVAIQMASDTLSILVPSKPRREAQRVTSPPRKDSDASQQKAL